MIRNILFWMLYIIIFNAVLSGLPLFI